MQNNIATPNPTASPFSQFHYYQHRDTLERAQLKLGIGTLASTARFSVGLVAQLPSVVTKHFAQNGISPRMQGVILRAIEEESGTKPLPLDTPSRALLDLSQEEIDLILEHRRQSVAKLQDEAPIDTSSWDNESSDFEFPDVGVGPTDPHPLQDAAGPSQVNPTEPAWTPYPEGDVPPLEEEKLTIWTKLAYRRAKKRNPSFGVGTSLQRMAVAFMLLHSIIPDRNELNTWFGENGFDRPRFPYPCQDAELAVLLLIDQIDDEELIE